MAHIIKNLSAYAIGLVMIVTTIMGAMAADDSKNTTIPELSDYEEKLEWEGETLSLYPIDLEWDKDLMSAVYKAEKVAKDGYLFKYPKPMNVEITKDGQALWNVVSTCQLYQVGDIKNSLEWATFSTDSTCTHTIKGKGDLERVGEFICIASTIGTPDEECIQFPFVTIKTWTGTRFDEVPLVTYALNKDTGVIVHPGKYDPQLAPIENLMAYYSMNETGTTYPQDTAPDANDNSLVGQSGTDFGANFAYTPGWNGGNKLVSDGDWSYNNGMKTGTGDGFTLISGDDFSVCGVFTNNQTGDEQAIFRDGGEFGLYRRPDTDYMFQFSGNFFILEGSDIAANYTHHACFVFDNSINTINFYENGVYDSNDVLGTDEPVMANAELDMFHRDLQKEWFGDIQHFRIWFGKALTAAEVNDTYCQDAGNCTTYNDYPTTPTGVTREGTSNFTGSFNSLQNIQCSGSTDPEGDTITYLVYKGNDTLTTTYDTCYQELATVATNCGGLATGAYATTGTWHSSMTAVKSYDGNLDSFGSANWLGTNATLFTNYTVPSNNHNATTQWYVKTGLQGGEAIDHNYLDIPDDCWASTLEFKVDSDNSGTAVAAVYMSCRNQTSGDFVLLLKDDTADQTPAIWEEAMVWNTTNVPGTEYTLIGNHTAGNNLSWDLSAETLGDTFENIRCWAVDNNSHYGTSNYTIDTLFTIASGDTSPEVVSGSESFTLHDLKNGLFNYSLTFNVTDVEDDVEACWAAHNDGITEGTLTSGVCSVNFTFAHTGSPSINASVNDTGSREGTGTEYEGVKLDETYIADTSNVNTMSSQYFTIQYNITSVVGNYTNITFMGNTSQSERVYNLTNATPLLDTDISFNGDYIEEGTWTIGGAQFVADTAYNIVRLITFNNTLGLPFPQILLNITLTKYESNVLAEKQDGASWPDLDSDLADPSFTFNLSVLNASDTQIYRYSYDAELITWNGDTQADYADEGGTKHWTYEGTYELNWDLDGKTIKKTILEAAWPEFGSKTGNYTRTFVNSTGSDKADTWTDLTGSWLHSFLANSSDDPVHTFDYYTPIVGAGGGGGGAGAPPRDPEVVEVLVGQFNGTLDFNGLSLYSITLFSLPRERYTEFLITAVGGTVTGELEISPELAPYFIDYGVCELDSDDCSRIVDMKDGEKRLLFFREYWDEDFYSILEANEFEVIGQLTVSDEASEQNWPIIVQTGGFFKPAHKLSENIGGVTHNFAAMLLFALFIAAIFMIAAFIIGST